MPDTYASFPQGGGSEFVFKRKDVDVEETQVPYDEEQDILGKNCARMGIVWTKRS